MTIRRCTIALVIFFTMISHVFGSEAISIRSANLTVPSIEVRSNGTEQGALVFPSKVAETLVDDNFEGAFPGQWQLFSAIQTYWGQTSYRASRGSQSVYCAAGGDNPAPAGGPYLNDMNVWMVFGPFSLADAQEATVAFDLWMKTQPASGNTYFDQLFYGFSLDESNYSGFITAGDSGGWGAGSFSASDITAIDVLGQSQVWLGFGFQTDGSITDEGVYLDNIVLTKTTSNPCSLSCSASGPGSAIAGAPVSFTASATATNCSSQPTYNWDFGDSSQDSTARNPSHTYSSPGSYTWTMTAQADTETCTKTGTITVTGSSIDFEREYWVPAAAHAQGNHGSQWRTDLCLFNPGQATANVRVDFHDGGTIRTLSRSLAAGSSELLQEVIGMYNVSGSGALEILTDEEIHVTSRTFNQGSSGTFGQYLGGVDPAFGLRNQESAALPQLREDSAFRTNIGILNTSDSSATVKVELFDGTGALLRTVNRTLSPGILKQLNQPFSELAGQNDLEIGRAVVTVTSGSGVLAYASVIDNSTQDPTTIPMKSGYTEVRQGWVAAASHASGSLGSQWRTDLGLLNLQDSTAHVTITLHVGSDTYDLTTTVGPGVQKVFDDIVGQIGRTGTGSLEISSDVGLYITSRTYNLGSAGTFGQFLDGYSGDAGIGMGQSAYLPQLSQNSAFRSNIGFLNTSDSQASIRVQLLASDGSNVGQFTKTLASGANWQKDRPFSTVAGQDNISGGTAKVEVTSGSGIIAYASVIDNDTQDPTTIPMQGGARFGGIVGTVQSSSGAVISNAVVEAAGQSTTTNSQGAYELDSIPVSSETPVSFSKDGFVMTVKVLRVIAGESTTQDAVLLPVEASTTISATAGGSLSTSDGASITIPPNSLVTSTGQAFTGTANVTLTSFDPSIPKELDAFPGTFEGIGLDGVTVGINTYGFADITVTSGSQPLQLAPGAGATLDIPIPSTLLDQAPSTIPSWWFDPDTGSWYEVGSFARIGNKFRSTIPHFSIWNCDVASTRCYVSGRVVDEDGDPIKGARVTFRSFRRNGGYVTSGETSTPSDGTFRVPVDANADIEFWATKDDFESAHLFDQACENNGEMTVADIILETGIGDLDFSYTYKNPNDPDSKTYIVSTSNAKVSEEIGGYYWHPEFGSDTFETTTPGEVIYHFHFDSSIEAAELFARLTTFHWSYSRGHNRLYASRDGADWVLLLDVLPPEELGGFNYGAVNGELPQSVLGSHDLWLKVELYSYGPNASEGWTNTAQHSRYDGNLDNTTFSLQVWLE